MKTKSILILCLFLGAMTLSSCTIRLVDFTVISSKNVNLNIDKAKGKKVYGKKSYFLGIGWNIKDAMDLALESAGNEYDMLVDGVVRYSNYPFILVINVEGTAINSDDMKRTMGDAGFQNWLEGKDVNLDRSDSTGKTE